MNLAVVGAGGWGTALACVLASKNNDVLLWGHNPVVVNEINTRRANATYLPDVHIPESIVATHDVAELGNADAIVLAIPTQFIRPALATYNIPLQEKIVISGSKGVEQNTLLRVSEILNDVAGVRSENFVALTGPSHAEEVAKGVPTTVVAASVSASTAHYVQNMFSTPTFRVYSSQDAIGAELGGALKNVIAISSGIIDGLAFGDNTKAALMTRGLVEITRLGIAMGAEPATFSGLSGLGDLIVTCMSRHSRNRWVGEQIGKGKKLEHILSETKKVAEGVATTVSARALSHKYNVEMPIVEQVYQVLFEQKEPREAIQTLMLREAKPEVW